MGWKERTRKCAPTELETTNGKAKNIQERKNISPATDMLAVTLRKEVQLRKCPYI